MNNADMNQGRGLNPPQVGLLDILFAIALGFILFELLMAWMEA